MIVKRYYAKDMQEAMATIRAELGSDAVILSSKQVRKKGITGFFQKKELEVIAAYEPRLESPRVREERESATVQAAIQAVQEAQSRVVPPVPQIQAVPSGQEEYIIDAPPPSPGQPMGPIDGRSRAQARPMSQTPYQPPQKGYAPPQPQRAQPAYEEPVTRQASPSPVSAAMQEQPMPQAYAPPAPEQAAGQSVARQAVARYSQTAGLSHEAQAQPQEPEERPVFTRGPRQAYDAYKPKPPSGAGGGKLGDDLPFEVEDLDAVQVTLSQPEPPRIQQTEPPRAEPQPVPEPARAVEEPAPQEVTAPAEGPEEYEIADPRIVALATPISASLSEEESAKLEALDQKLNALGSMVESFAKKYEFIRHDSDYKYDAEIEPYLFKLLDNDVEQELAHALARATQESVRAGQPPRHALEELLRGVIGPVAPLNLTEGRPVLLFMGPTGVGKTTTLVKLATMCSVRDKRKVGLINTDTYRIAAQEQLRTYAEILDVPLKVVYTPSDLASAIAEMADRDVIFVDTAGKRPGDPQHRADMLDLMEAAGGDALPLLAVSAPTSQRAMRELFDHYDFLPEYSLLLTKTDETSGWGAAVNACHLSGMPIAYLTGGQSVPDDIEQADASELVRRLLR